MSDFDSAPKNPIDPPVTGATPLDERFSATTIHPIHVDQVKEWTEESAQTAGMEAVEEEPPPPFAQPSAAPKKLHFTEESQNIPAPAPFEIMQVTDPPAESPPAAEPEADATVSGNADSVSREAESRLAELQAAETIEMQAVDKETVAQRLAAESTTPQDTAPQDTTSPDTAPQEETPRPLDVVPAAVPTNISATSVSALNVPATINEPATGPSGNTPPPYLGPPAADRRLSLAIDVMARLKARMRSQILGRDEVIDLVLVALLADGHVLLEDFPGSGKTTLAKALGGSIIDQVEAEEIADFRRIQFTPDLLPSDVTGVSIFDVTTNQFHFRRGPIFAHVVLADEINRTSPKVQSAMLEAMAEKQVTIDNVTYALDDLFFVIATQNPLDLAGTYPLPVAQLDRFLFKIRMDHIDRQSELEVLNTYRQRRDMERQDLPKVTRLDVIAARKAIDEHVAIDPPIKECLVDIAHTLRQDERVLQGNSTRSLVLMLPALQAMAALRGRDFVSSEDIQALVPRVMGHRVELAPGVNDLDQVLVEVMEGPIEALSRSTLRRGR